ncbi:MAG: YgjV family protein [Ruminococcaceae bacterium]|nr:YgjV family protein [Oscillospiraceae bacterium]
MTTFEIFAQALGIIAMIFNILSYQQKTAKGAMIIQFLGSLFFSMNFFMLGATVGGIMNTIAMFRSVVFMNKKKLKADNILWLIFFISLYVISYILTFTVFNKEISLFNMIIEFLPIIGMTATTISYRLQSAKAIRGFGLISSPSWLIYNIINVAVGATICEILTLCSIAIGIVRYDIKKK